LYPNSRSDSVNVNGKKGGGVRDDGRDFDRDDVMKTAMKLVGQKRKAG